MLGLLRKRAERIAGTTVIDLSTPLERANYVVMDTELTGLDARTDSIVSIGALRMTGSRIELNNSFYEVVRPRTGLTAGSIVVHEITPSETEKMTGIEGILEEFLRFCDGAVIVGHFISLDLRFLTRELKGAGFSSLNNPAVDTCTIYEWMYDRGDFSSGFFARTGTKDLFSIAKKFRIPVQGAHNAIMDAFVTAQLFQRFIAMLMKLGVRTLSDLLRIGKP